MNYDKKWKIIDELGSGEQGRVYRARDKKEFNDDAICMEIRTALQPFTATITHSNFNATAANDDLHRCLKRIEQRMNESSYCALKVFHKGPEARDLENSAERMASEIKAMSSVSHANLLKIIDHDANDLWFASEFHSKGPLNKNLQGPMDPLNALKSIRALVDGLNQLHSRKWYIGTSSRKISSWQETAGWCWAILVSFSSLMLLIRVSRAPSTTLEVRIGCRHGPPCGESTK